MRLPEDATPPGPADFRLGQQVWNLLDLIAPALVEPYRGGPLDPFHDIGPADESWGFPSLALTHSESGGTLAPTDRTAPGDG